MTEIERRKILRLSNEESNRMTRDCIESALIILMKTKNFESISVTDIVNRAGVSRSAYYRNYSSKEDILKNVFNRAGEAIVSALMERFESSDKKAGYQIIFEKVMENHTLFEIILMADLTYKFQTEMNIKYLQSVKTEDTYLRYRVISWIGSVFSIIFEWVNSGYTEPPEVMAQICSSFISDEEWRIGTAIKWDKSPEAL